MDKQMNYKCSVCPRTSSKSAWELATSRLYGKINKIGTKEAIGSVFVCPGCGEEQFESELEVSHE